jgi:Tol biopolymer transport system component
VSNDTNGVSDVFLHNNQTGETSRVSVDSNGVEGNADSHSVDVSDDGRYVVFASGSDNLVPGMAGYFGSNIFLHDTQTGETTLVSRDLSGEPASAVVDSPSISGNGRYIFFTANANLVCR